MAHPRPSTDLRDTPRGTGPVAAILAALFVVLVLLHPTRFLFDDAYFYLVIAEQVVTGEGSTFHGLGPTNGYHPLWLAACVPVVALARAVGASALHLVLVLQMVLGIGMAALFVRLARRVALPHPPIAFAILGVYFLAGGVWGSEGWLNGLLQAAGLVLLLRAHRRPDRLGGWLAAGAVIGLAVLARLDLVFLAAAACLAALFQPGRAAPRRLRDAVVMGLAITAVVAPYLLANMVTTGHMMPVSGAVKSTFPVPRPAGILDKWGTLGRTMFLGGLVACALAAAGGVRGSLRRLLGVLGGATVAHAAYVGLFTGARWSTDYDYYYVTGAFTLACAAGVLLDRFGRLLPSFDRPARSRMMAGLGGLLVLIGLVRAGSQVLAPGAEGLTRTPEPSTVRLARWMGAHLPADARVYTIDAPGRLAWFSGRPVLAADGLTHTRAFGPALRRQGLQGWLDARGVTHLVSLLDDYRTPWIDVTRLEPGRVRAEAIDPWTGERVGAVVLEASEAVITTADLGLEDPDDPVVGVWAWPLP